jgi:hypothetical protein
MREPLLPHLLIFTNPRSLEILMHLWKEQQRQMHGIELIYGGGTFADVS